MKNQRSTEATLSRPRVLSYAGAGVLVALLAFTACSDVTGPGDADDAQTIIANGPALGGLISSESARILPSVAKSPATDEVTFALDQLTIALQAGLGNESRIAIERFNAAADEIVNSTNNPDVAAEISALRHSVEVVREAVEPKGT